MCVNGFIVCICSNCGVLLITIISMNDNLALLIFFVYWRDECRLFRWILKSYRTFKDSVQIMKKVVEVSLSYLFNIFSKFSAIVFLYFLVELFFQVSQYRVGINGYKPCSHCCAFHLGVILSNKEECVVFQNKSDYV